MSLLKKRLKTGEEKTNKIPKSALEKMVDHIYATNYIDPELYPKYNVKRGLRNSNGTGVVVGLTKIGEVFGYSTDENGKKVPAEGELFYRGYNVKDLARNYIKENRFGFEEVTYLLIFGTLPTKEQLDRFSHYIAERRELPVGFARDMILTAPSPNLMNKLARSCLALYSYDDNPDDISVYNVLRQSIGLMGYFPALIAYSYQAKLSYFDKKSMNLHYPVPELGTAENILRMIRPTGEYTDLEAKALDIALVLHAEHGGGNNSSFTTHLLSSTGTDTYSAISAAVGSLKGPRHGGANLSVLKMIKNIKENVHDISNNKEVDNYLRKILKGQANDGSGLIYGMGHAVYTKSDPRAIILKQMAGKLAENKGLIDDYLLCSHIEEATPRLFAEVKGTEVEMCANVDLYSGFVYNALNIPVEISTPLFALARLPGWCAHRLEELVTNNKLIRPAYRNVEERKEFVPISERELPEIDKKQRQRNTISLPKFK